MAANEPELAGSESVACKDRLEEDSGCCVNNEFEVLEANGKSDILDQIFF